MGVFLIAEFALIGYAIRGAIPPGDVREVSGYEPWSDEVIEVAEAIPVQEGGRIKPLRTYARFKMMSFHGSLKMKVKAGGKVHKIGPVAWILDCMFRPDLADKLPVFLLDDTEILKPFGIDVKDRRARLSFKDLEEGGDPEENGFIQLVNRGRELLEKQSAEGEESLNSEEKEVVRFAQLALNYTGIRDSMDIVRGGLPDLDPAQLAYVDQEIYQMLRSKMDPGQFGFWLPILPETIQSTQRLESQQAREFEYELNRQLSFARWGPAWIPPQEGEEEEWQTIEAKVTKFLKKELTDSVEILKDFEKLEVLSGASKRPNSGEFLTALTDWQASLTERANKRAEGDSVTSEVSYYNRNYFMKGLVYFIIAFLVSAVGWIIRDGTAGKVVSWLTAIIYGVATGYVLGGLFHRYMITGRPPVSNLYDTIPFITAGAVVILAAAEAMTRRKVLLSLGAGLGVVGLFFAFSFELGDAKDNMDPLRAVLDSNYWLATHVVSITIGYCGGLVACFLSLVYVHLALAGVIKDQKSFHRFMTRTVYGITCFTLLFSLVGTILGGIWANDSWGRFWGWDPKENGALLIVLWCLIILHSRLAGWMTGWGLHIMSILGGSVVVFSWWGVNMLEVGLHSYGFIEGASTVYYFYFVTLVATGVGVAAWLLERASKTARVTPGSPAVAPKV
ncbi:cytochrome c biogenesis protein CcsA [Akkermansiaceae bacterium]|nr:cytochrome c biogenesis protein CcsA [Akkermansiaceae bacterium]